MNEANNILHQYEFGALRDEIIHAGVGGATGGSSGRDASEYRYRMGPEPFSGQDPIAVAEEAVRWWGDQLDQIEADAAERARSSPAP